MQSKSFIYTKSVISIFLLSLTLPTFAEIPKNLPTTSAELENTVIGWIGRTGMGYYVSAKYRPTIKMLQSNKPQRIAPLLDSMFKKDPDAQDLYVALVQADITFRKEEWEKYKKPQTNIDARFRRGTVILYRAHEWRAKINRSVFAALLTEAIADLEYVWNNKPTVMVGAVLMDAYDLNSPDTSHSNPVSFTEDFLKYVDPDYTWLQYLQAKRVKFLNSQFDPNRIPKSKKYPIAGILGERWSLLYNFPSPFKNERAMLERWRRSIPIND